MVSDLTKFEVVAASAPMGSRVPVARFSLLIAGRLVEVEELAIVGRCLEQRLGPFLAEPYWEPKAKTMMILRPWGDTKSALPIPQDPAPLPAPLAEGDSDDDEPPEPPLDAEGLDPQQVLERRIRCLQSKRRALENETDPETHQPLDPHWAWKCRWILARIAKLEAQLKGEP